MNIAGREIGPDQPPYIVAEISGNHIGDISIARELIVAAKQAGADAVKFQAYEADTITIDCDKPDFIIKDGPWKGRKLHELYSKAQTPFAWFPQLFAWAKEVGITCFASVFDPSSVDMLEGLGCPAYKIASMEIVDIPLIQYAAKTGKPLIISTGMAAGMEVADAWEATSFSQTAFLHCVSSYPTPIGKANLSGLKRLIDSGFPMGISDHTDGWIAPVLAITLGARIVEKHLKRSRYDDTEDAAFSLTPEQFSKMAVECELAWYAMRAPTATSEESSRQLRRSLYAVADIKVGEALTTANVRSIRPAYGLPPKELPNVLGKKAATDIERGTALAWELLA
jgi:pseudaminic acid synthase